MKQSNDFGPPAADVSDTNSYSQLLYMLVVPFSCSPEWRCGGRT